MKKPVMIFDASEQRRRQANASLETHVAVAECRQEVFGLGGLFASLKNLLSSESFRYSAPSSPTLLPRRGEGSQSVLYSELRRFHFFLVRDTTNKSVLYLRTHCTISPKRLPPAFSLRPTLNRPLSPSPSFPLAKHVRLTASSSSHPALHARLTQSYSPRPASHVRLTQSSSPRPASNVRLTQSFSPRPASGRGVGGEGLSCSHRFPAQFTLVSRISPLIPSPSPPQSRGRKEPAWNGSEAIAS